MQLLGQHLIIAINTNYLTHLTLNCPWYSQLEPTDNNNNRKKGGHRRTPSLIGPVDLLKKGMAKIAPAPLVTAAPTVAEAGEQEHATVMDLIGNGPGVDNQQLDIPVFKTEEGRYLATGKAY